MINVNSYAGKHVLEQIRGVYTSADDFEKFMANVGVSPFLKQPDVFPIRLKKKYQTYWRTNTIP